MQLTFSILLMFSNSAQGINLVSNKKKRVLQEKNDFNLKEK